MEIICSKKNASYKVAMTNYGLAVINKTNSWPVTLIGNKRWTCEHMNLPKYVKLWLDKLACKANN